jgi:hypothetical protein
LPKNWNLALDRPRWQSVRDTDFVSLCLDPIDVLRGDASGIENGVTAFGNLRPEFV